MAKFYCPCCLNMKYKEEDPNCKTVCGDCVKEMKDIRATYHEAIARFKPIRNWSLPTFVYRMWFKFKPKTKPKPKQLPPAPVNDEEIF